MHVDEGNSLSLFFSSFISAARMHARFNNASSSMRSQRVGSFLTSTRALLTLHPPPSRNLSAPRSILFFVHSRRCTRSVVVHRVCTSERASASSTCFSLFYETCEKRLLTRAPYSYGNPFFSLELGSARGFSRLRTF